MDNLVSILQATAEIYSKQLSHAAAVMFLSDLSIFPEKQVMAALSRCRKELRTFPTLADILVRIEDGRPGIEEAWSLCPASEDQSTVWTTEVRDAYFAGASALIGSDPVAARMAFKEKYSEILAAARASGKPANWEASLGHDKAGQERALVKAVSTGRLSAQEATALLPDLSHDVTKHNPQLAQITARSVKLISGGAS